MARNIARRRVLPVIASGVAAFSSGCGTVQQFDPAPDHLRTIEGNRDVPPAVTQLPAPPAPVPRPPQETYSVVVTDVPVRDVLFALARDAGVNVDVSGDLPGNVTINAIDQTLPQILDRISRQASIRYSLDNGTLVVLPDAPYWQNYRVDYVNLSRTTEGEVTVATQIATAGGSVGEDEESGGSGESESNGSKTMVKNTSENAFWPVLGANLRQLITGKSQAAEGGTDGPDPVVVNPMSGMVSVRATGAQHRQIQEYLDQLSAGAKRQVLIEITVVEVNLSDQYQAGVDWATVSSQGGLGKDGVSLISDLIGGNLAAAPVFTGTYNNFEADGSGFSATIKLLSQFGDAKVLSTPRIMALNNQTALLKVVDELVYFTLTSETIEGTDNSLPRTIITSEINTVPVGFVMSVTPQISENGNVSLNVRPTLTRVIDFVVDPAPRLAGSDFDNLVPQLKVSEIESLLEVADGQTVVIGGLMQDRTSKQTDGIPYLSRIPLVGDLFSFRNDEVSKSELVLFLRPTVIRGAGVGQEGLASRGIPLPAATQAASGEVATP
ncbi:MAG: pilus (MSHA type) biogenesis protein MshL [Gammaproteobacteria bacterium]|nr:pilus (MSHA type) biogenesis protein MshL [Gammaproteobacteria bacterium]